MIEGYFVNGPWAGTYRDLPDGTEGVRLSQMEGGGGKFSWKQSRPDEPVGVVQASYEVWYERLDGAVAYRFIPPSQ